jgi:hypothetical protein
MIVGVVVSLTGMVIAYALCVEHIVNLMGWRLQNDWTPFQGGFWDTVRQIPQALYECITYYPEASFTAFVFYPLAVVAFAIYEAVHWQFDLIVMGWLPFMVGVAIFLFSGLLIEKTDIA